MDAIICVTVVLPLLPVTAISGSLNCARQPAASAPSASLLSSHLDARQARRHAAAMGDGRNGAPGLRVGQEVVGVEALALERHEQVARLQRAGVAVHALRRRGAVAHQRAAGHPGQRLGQA